MLQAFDGVSSDNAAPENISFLKKPRNIKVFQLMITKFMFNSILRVDALEEQHDDFYFHNLFAYRVEFIVNRIF